MHKHKQKAKKHNFFRHKLASRKPLLAAVAFALVAAPASWLVVSAHPASDEAAGIWNGYANGSSAAAGSDGTNKGARAQSGAAGPASEPGKPAGKPSDSSQKDSAKTKTDSKTSANTKNQVAPPAPSSVPPKPQPAPATPASGWHDNIASTIFWVGEAADGSNAYISNSPSAWDGNWQTHYGGVDDPANRNGYHPTAFTPKENPFYVALPYNDLDTNGNRKASASSCPNTGNSISWCKNAWVKITKGSKTAYAQWQDVGPIQEDDTAYVFGSAAPKNTWGAKAGIDLSPALKTYLGLSDVDRVGWGFVSAGAVPSGPWRDIITTSQGGW